MKNFKKVLASVLAAALVVALVNATPAKATVKTVTGWDSTTVASFAETVDFAAIKAYKFTVKTDKPITNTTNFLVVVQNTEDWAWSQFSVGDSTSSLDYQGIPYDNAWTQVDDNTLEFTVINEGKWALKTMNDKLAIGDWSADYDITDVKVEFLTEVPAQPEPETPDVTEAPADETPKTGASLAAAALLASLCAAGFVGTKVTKKDEQ